MEDVAGSIPAARSKFYAEERNAERRSNAGVWCSPVNTFPCHGKDRGFKSRRSRQSLEVRTYGQVVRRMPAKHLFGGSIPSTSSRFGAIAQLGARNHGMIEVVGSIPTSSTNIAGRTRFKSEGFNSSIPGRGLGRHDEGGPTPHLRSV